MIVVQVSGMDDFTPSHADELQQLFELPHSASSRLILIGTASSDLAQTLIAHLQVVIKPFSESDLLAIKSANLGEYDTAVQPTALELCAQQSYGNVSCATDLCRLATKLVTPTTVATRPHLVT